MNAIGDVVCDQNTRLQMSYLVHDVCDNMYSLQDILVI